MFQLEFDRFSDCHVPAVPVTIGHFEEFAFQVPFAAVASLAGARNTTFQPLAYVDNAFGSLAVLTLGAVRETAAMAWADAAISVAARDGGAALLSVDYAAAGDFVPAAEAARADPRWAGMAAGKAQPELGYAAGLLSGKRFTCSDLRYDVAGARVRPVAGRLVVAPGFEARAPVGRWFPARTLDLAGGGVRAYEVETSFAVAPGCAKADTEAPLLA